MDELLVEKILETDNVTRRQFLGAFARDELPARPPYPSCFIFNSEPRVESGEHWLAVYFNKHGYAHFFDSYGHEPEFFGMEQYLNQTALGWTFNRRRIQGSSDLCGLYCILFLLYATRNNLFTFFNQFKNSQTKNDSLLLDLLKFY